MLGDAGKNEAHWEVNVFHNRFVKEDGMWKVREMRLFPILRPTIRPAGARAVWTAAGPPTAHVPRAQPRDGEGRGGAGGDGIVATSPLTGAIPASRRRVPPADMTERLEDDARRLRMVTAYDGAEHVSTTYGMYADDFQWPPMAAIFGRRGAKQIPFVGYYKSAERIARATYLEWGDPTDTRTKLPGTGGCSP